MKTKLIEIYQFISKIFTHITGEIKAGNARFHAQIQVNLRNFDPNTFRVSRFFLTKTAFKTILCFKKA